MHGSGKGKAAVARESDIGRCSAKKLEGVGAAKVKDVLCCATKEEAPGA